MHVEDNATATLMRVRVLRNRAGTGGGLNAYRGRYDVFQSIVDGNQSTSGFGGGIAASSNFATAQAPGSIINLTTTLVRNNTATLGGGIVVLGDNFSGERASMSLAGSVVSGNQSQGQGGGILVTRTNLTAADSLIINNSVAGGASPFGGGLLATQSAATINTTTIAHNTAGQYRRRDVHRRWRHQHERVACLRQHCGSGRRLVRWQWPVRDHSGQHHRRQHRHSLNGQIHENTCSSVTYPNNLITSTAFVGCASLASRAPGTDSTSKPRFAKFLAVPSNGVTTTLAWSVARASSVTIAGVGTWNSPNNSPTGTVDVTPGPSTTYSLAATASSANGGNYGSVTVGAVGVVPAPSSLRVVRH